MIRLLSSRSGTPQGRSASTTLLKVSIHVSLSAANGIIVVYGINDDRSFERVERWIG